MVDPISVLGAITSSMTLTSATLQSVKGLYDKIRSYRDYPETVEHLETELYGLLVALRKVEKLDLDETTATELKPILKACDKACSVLRQAIEKCTSQSGGKERHFGDWAKLEFLDGNITMAKETLAGYKATIAIIINAINLVKNDIDQVRKTLDGPLATSGSEKDTSSRKIRQITSKKFEDAQKLVAQCASQLQEMKEEAKSQREEQQYHMSSIQHCISVVEKRAEQASGLTFERIDCKPHALQVISTGSATTLTAKDIHAESYGTQLMGEHQSGTVEKLIENHGFRPRTSLPLPRRRLFGFIPIGRRNVSNTP
ncbi:hypothetical protein ZTR_09838 [Talaromyces verruculosus]|nr:hypothetical protein ZTR_09838 [Talaromyces verruculosus]